MKPCGIQDAEVRAVESQYYDANRVVVSCVCCGKDHIIDNIKETLHLNIVTSDGWNVCNNECKTLWEGTEFEQSATQSKHDDKCIFCNGKGKIARYHHIENGKCFRCNGTGKKGRSIH